jgi:phage baseplate assembly protein W
MQGVDARTGRPLAGLEHLRQSVRDILLTPIGSRVELREYGSNLFRLVDRPLDDVLRIDLIAATVDALRRWEPRIEVRRVGVSDVGVARITLDLEGVYLPDGRHIRLDGIVIQ